MVYVKIIFVLSSQKSGYKIYIESILAFMQCTESILAFKCMVGVFSHYA